MCVVKQRNNVFTTLLLVKIQPHMFFFSVSYFFCLPLQIRLSQQQPGKQEEHWHRAYGEKKEEYLKPKPMHTGFRYMHGAYLIFKKARGRRGASLSKLGGAAAVVGSYEDEGVNASHASLYASSSSPIIEGPRALAV